MKGYIFSPYGSSNSGSCIECGASTSVVKVAEGEFDDRGDLVACQVRTARPCSDGCKNNLSPHGRHLGMYDDRIKAAALAKAAGWQK